MPEFPQSYNYAPPPSQINLPSLDLVVTFRGNVDRAAIIRHVDELKKQGLVPPEKAHQLVNEAFHAAALYFAGAAIRPILVQQREDKLPPESAAYPPRNRPPRPGDRSFIVCMATIFDWLGANPGRANYPSEYGPRPGYQSDFQDFVGDWIKVIDPERIKMPSSSAFQKHLAAWHREHDK